MKIVQYVGITIICLCLLILGGVYVQQTFFPFERGAKTVGVDKQPEPEVKKDEQVKVAEKVAETEREEKKKGAIVSGQFAVINNPCFAATSEEAQDEMYAYIREGNTDGIMRMMVRYDIFKLPKGTGVNVVKRGFTTAVVEVVNTGEVGIVPVEFLSHPDDEQVVGVSKGADVTKPSASASSHQANKNTGNNQVSSVEQYFRDLKTYAGKGQLKGVSVKIGDTQDKVTAKYKEPLDTTYFNGGDWHVYPSFVIIFNKNEEEETNKIVALAIDKDNIKKKHADLTFAQIKKFLGNHLKKHTTRIVVKVIMSGASIIKAVHIYFPFVLILKKEK